MNFFLHYIGVEGAARDFPKTVFTDRPTGLVIERVPDVHPGKAFLLTRLGDAFPEGRWNCWGVPDGAGPAIGRLSEGDLFLLMETSSGPGAVPAMGRVEAFVPQRFPHLSNALWGERGFPYIFFFRTIPLALTWIDLRARLGYKPTYDGPRGQVQRIREEHVRHAGGVRALERWLYSKEDREAVDRFSLNPRRLVRESPELYDVQAEHDALITTSIEDEPELTDDVDAREVTSYSYPRTEAFRLDIRRLYGERCAICDLGIRGPEGQPEVQSAHIYPRHLKGKDDLRNGICLCRMHHWALDIGWIAFSDARRVIVRDGLPNNPDYAFVREYARKAIREPSATHFAPHPVFLRAHRELFDFE